METRRCLFLWIYVDAGKYTILVFLYSYTIPILVFLYRQVFLYSPDVDGVGRWGTERYVYQYLVKTR